jgi:glycosyltransferase involved in cell wall biosynthesis
VTRRAAPPASSSRRLRVLVISAQFPFPVRSGFASRVYNLARETARRHDVTLLAYATAAEAAAVGDLRGVFGVETVPAPAPTRLAKRVTQLVSATRREPYASRAVRSDALQAAAHRIVRDARIDVVQLESSVLAAIRLPAGVPVVLDEHNIEYEVAKRLQAGEASLVRRRFQAVEYTRLLRFEQAAWQRAAAVVVTSPREAEMIRAEAPRTPVSVVPNGVDTDAFIPAARIPEPGLVVFNGLLGYRPNLDAARWLVDDVWPRIRRGAPNARLLIVGRGDPADLRRLERDGVTTTGEVADVRPYLERATVVAVPVRMGGGTRLKVVEALAMGKAMVSTSLGCEGIKVRDETHLLVADTAVGFAAATLRALDDPPLRRALGTAGRVLATSEYAWPIAAATLDATLRAAAARSPRRDPPADPALPRPSVVGASS